MRNRPGDVVREMRRDQGEIRRGGTIGGNASWKVEIEKCKVTTFDGLDERVTASIIQRRKPTITVGVKVARNDCIASNLIQRRVEGRTISGCTRGGGRDIDVVDGDFQMTKVDVDGL